MCSCLGQQSRHLIRRSLLCQQARGKAQAPGGNQVGKRRCIPPAAERIPLAGRHIGQDEAARLGEAAHRGDLLVRQRDAVREHEKPRAVPSDSPAESTSGVIQRGGAPSPAKARAARRVAARQELSAVSASEPRSTQASPPGRRSSSQVIRKLACE